MINDSNKIPEPGTETVSGIVDTIIFQNEENGYTVFLLEDTNGDPVTVNGTVPYLTEGDKITVAGAWTNHPTYGRQFRCDSYEKSLPTEEGDILRYLASGVIKGVGPKTAQKIVERFGTDTFDVIEHHYTWLCDISGITPKRAAKIRDNYNAISGARAVLMFCSDYFTPQTAMKIYQKWGSAAIDKIRQNPYRLCEDFWGISFRRADQIALAMGGSVDSGERILHGAVYVLRSEAARSGHTCLPFDEVVRCTADLLFPDDEAGAAQIPDVLRAAAASGRLREAKKGDGSVLFDPRMYDSERYIASKLKAVDARCPTISQGDAVLLIQKAERDAGIAYADLQRRALFSALSGGVMILTGGPGTGKTTIIKGLISIFDSLGQKVTLAAPTGRAAKRMSEATSHEAGTIHRLLEMEFADESGARFLRNEDNTLEADAVIVDEASMIDVPLMEALLRAIKNGARLILIGDADQLPPVGAGNVLADVIASDCFTVVRLTEIFRQSAESLIITNAHRIHNGELPLSGKKDSDFFILPRRSDEEIAATVVDLVKNRLPRTYGPDIIAETQVITPSRKGYAGTELLNRDLQASLNPPSRGKSERRLKDIVYRTGDRVMQTKNNYAIEWETSDGREGLGIFNGDIGTVTGMDAEENTVEVRFDERICQLDFASLEEVDHAYAITVHKSQGSEYPVVILPLYACAPMLLTRNLLYTAVTRATKMVILVGRQDILEQMIETDRRVARCTMLREFLLTT